MGRVDNIRANTMEALEFAAAMNGADGASRKVTFDLADVSSTRDIVVLRAGLNNIYFGSTREFWSFAPD